MSSWDTRFLEMARLVSNWSKDPSSKFGSVIVDNDKRIVSVGFNGFAKGFSDLDERLQNREFKYRHVLHSEENCILNASQDIKGFTIYVTGVPCSLCMSRIAQSGLAKVVSYKPTEDYLSRWSVEEPLQVAKECGVIVEQIEEEIWNLKSTI
jgi:dCMP deaminase